MAAGPSYSDVEAKLPLGDSSSGGAQANNCTLTPEAHKTAYLSEFTVTGLGATGQSVIAVTVTGSNATHTPTWYVNIPAGATVGVVPLVVQLPTPIAGAAPGTPLVLNVPSFGNGNLTAGASASGFQQ